MAAPMVAGLPPWFNLESGYQLRITAQNPLTGAVVSGVIVSNVSYSVDDQGTSPLTPAPEQLPVDTPWLVPVAS